MHVLVYTTGRASNEPGPAAIGIQICTADGVVFHELAEAIGNSTSEFAAYQAVVRGLQLTHELYSETKNPLTVEVILDDAEVAQQLSHQVPITHPGLVPLFIEIHNLRVSHFPQLTLTQVKRERNKEVNRLVNEALDAA